MPSPSERFTAPVAVHLFLTRDDHILLLRRFNTGYEDGNYSVIAGHVDGGETVLEATRREAREEAGIDLDPTTTRVVQVMHRLSDDSERIDYFLVADRWTGDITNCEPEKCDELRWVPVASLPPNTVPYVAFAIAAWRAGSPFTAFGWNS
jgi:8-oxo-dGTP pyrophosphatase MutT (NUDIX family)